jgi:hypothetical protein
MVQSVRRRLLTAQSLRAVFVTANSDDQCDAKRFDVTPNMKVALAAQSTEQIN